MAEPRRELYNVRISDADRERVAEQLRVAAGDGRLTLEELDQRLEAAYAARTYGELEPLTADLPAGGPRTVAPRDTVELRGAGGTLRRDGRWLVPRNLVVRHEHGSVRLDFTEATIEPSQVDIVLDRAHGSTRIVVPDGAGVDMDDLEMEHGSLKNKAAAVAAPGMPSFRIAGTQRHGSVRVHPPRKPGWLRLALLRLLSGRGS